MSKKRVNPDSLFRSTKYGFSQAVLASGRRTLYVSGQTAWDAEEKIVGAGDLRQQAEQAFRNLRKVMEASGGAMTDIVSLRIYVVGYRPEDAESVGAALRQAFPDPNRPASTWIGVASLARPEFLIEIEATAVLD